MKQLIEIKAKFLKSGDLIFDYKHRDLQKIEYVSLECPIGSTELNNIHVDYGFESMSADNFNPEQTVLILIDTDSLEIVEAENIGYR